MRYHAHMTEPLSLIVLISALATGLVTSIVSVTHLQGRQPEFFRYFLTNILLFNLLILSGLTLNFLQLRLQSADLAPHAFMLPGLLIIMAALKLGWLYAFIFTNLSLPADIAPPRLARKLAIAAAAIFVCYLGAMVAAASLRHEGLLQVTVILLETLIIGGALLTSLQLLFSASKVRDGKRRKSILVFGAYHCSLLGIILIVLVIGWLQPGPQRLAQLLAHGGFLALFNVFPLLWMKWFRPSAAVPAVERFELLGITQREREVIGLIQAGDSNQQIADKLFISVAAVSLHKNNLFRKTGVRNRLQLSNLFR